MAFIGVFLLGSLAGFVCAKLTVIFSSDEIAQNYPVGGFAPALLVVFNLGIDNTLLAACLLSIGGLFGYYLGVTIWIRYFQKGKAPHIVVQKDTDQHAHIADYLK